MRKVLRIVPFLFFLFVLDRFLFLPSRMAGTWEYEKGTYIGDSISFVQNIDIINNFEINILSNQKFSGFYLVGCYFGTLYLLDEKTLELTVYIKAEGSDSWF